MARRILGRHGNRSRGLNSNAQLRSIVKAAASAATPLEVLESRRLLSATAITVKPSITLIPDASRTTQVTGYTPSQIRNAYGFSTVSFNGASGDGTGQTIAIVDAFNDPNIKSDLAAFDNQFGIAAPPAFSIVSQTGSSKLPSTDASWAQETSLDVEWAHAVAPKANILLVETSTDSTTNLVRGVNYARSAPGVSVVSMSWGADEFSGQTSYDKYFTTPAGHTGVTFVAAAGDEGARGGAEWPASSPNVLAVGGTTLTLDSSGNITDESTWSDTSGGTSSIESTPAYQSSLGVTGRTTADVSYNADPDTGFATYDSLSYQGESGWSETGGTSAGTPQWAALVAIADQGRSLKGSANLDGASGTLPAIYNVYASSTQYAADFNDITTGGDGSTTGGGGHRGWGHGHGGWFGVTADAKTTATPARTTASTSTVSTTSAATGYDVPTGVGTPKAAGLIASLVSSRTAKSKKSVATAKIAKSSKVHRALKESSPVPIEPVAVSHSFVSHTPQIVIVVPHINALSAGESSSPPAIVAQTNSNETLPEANGSQPSLGVYVLEAEANVNPSFGQQAEKAVVAASSKIAAALVSNTKAVVTEAAVPTASAVATELFSMTHIDAAATFADAMSNFADECASLPALRLAPEHSTARAWALTGLIVAADAAILNRFQNKRCVK